MSVTEIPHVCHNNLQDTYYGGITDRAVSGELLNTELERL